MYGKQFGLTCKSEFQRTGSIGRFAGGGETIAMSTAPVRSRDPEGTKRLVLDSAERLFAERGFAGTSIRDVAQASGISHPLIQHHFATKEGLYRAVLRRCGDEYTAQYPEATNPDQPVDLRAEMTRLFGFVLERSRLIRMVSWARLEGRDDLFAEPSKTREAMIRRIEAGQQAGTIRLDIDAPTLGMMLDALLFYYLENREAAAVKWGHARDDAAYLEKAILLLERGTAANPSI